ncbi:MAG: glycosyltransferase, partial [Pyrinomonadaceae bacterium]
PPFGARWRAALNRRALLPLVRRAARNLRMRDPVLLTFLPTDTAVDMIRLLRTPHSVVVYYRIADFAHLTTNPERLGESERELLEMCDLVFAQCPELVPPIPRLATRTHIFPFGVNLDAFPQEDGGGASDVATGAPGDDHGGAGASRGAEVSALPRPLIGYVGGLHRHVDLRLLGAMARSRPDWSWVCVGPLQNGAGYLSCLPNVHLLGPRPHRALASYIRHFDVGIVPYVRSLYTETVVPTKINEYLAMGKPVVSTALPAVVDFGRTHGDVITADPRPESFLGAIERALQLAPDAGAASRRREVAARSDWATRLQKMSDLIEGAARANGSADEF